MNLEGEAAFAAARRLLALVGEVGPAFASALAATFLGDREGVFAELDALGAATGALAAATGSFFAHASGAVASDVDVAFLETGAFTVAAGAAPSIGSGLFSLERASKN